MSQRNDILDNFVDTVDGIKNVKIGKVSTKPEDFTKLARTAFPFVQVNIDGEERQDITMEHRLATMTVTCNVTIKAANKSKDVNDQLNEIHEAIEEALETDRTRGKKALLTEQVDTGTVTTKDFPLVSQTQTYVIQYYYTRGNS